MRTRYPQVGDTIRSTKQIGKEDVEPQLVQAINEFKETFASQTAERSAKAS
jgi:hypothetical protein